MDYLNSSASAPRYLPDGKSDDAQRGTTKGMSSDRIALLVVFLGLAAAAAQKIWGKRGALTVLVLAAVGALVLLFPLLVSNLARRGSPPLLDCFPDARVAQYNTFLGLPLPQSTVFINRRGAIQVALGQMPTADLSSNLLQLDGLFLSCIVHNRRGEDLTDVRLELSFMFIADSSEAEIHKIRSTMQTDSLTVGPYRDKGFITVPFRVKIPELRPYSTFRFALANAGPGAGSFAPPPILQSALPPTLRYSIGDDQRNMADAVELTPQAASSFTLVLLPQTKSVRKLLYIKNCFISIEGQYSHELNDRVGAEFSALPSQCKRSSKFVIVPISFSP